jgi:hypothetical protein
MHIYICTQVTCAAATAVPKAWEEAPMETPRTTGSFALSLFKTRNPKFDPIIPSRTTLTAACIYLFMYVCMYACVYVWMYVCVCICLYMFVHMCVLKTLNPKFDTIIPTRTTLTAACMYVFMYVCMYVSMYVCVCICLCMFVHMCVLKTLNPKFDTIIPTRTTLSAVCMCVCARAHLMRLQMCI